MKSTYTWLENAPKCVISIFSVVDLEMSLISTLQKCVKSEPNESSIGLFAPRSVRRECLIEIVTEQGTVESLP